MVARDHLAGRARLAVVEKDEVFDDVEQPVMRQHAVEQNLGVELPLIRLVVAFPLGKMLPLAGDRAIASMIAIADDQEGVVMERVRYDALAHVVAQIAVEAGADILVDGLQFDED